ncbi:Crp/Fnr family transcriptional regulator [Hymenobacter sp. YC55]|uniref:Crp/Fnr family transcriptional regulator n=1 Tax=Hymenobacter sp. YC55 TaxID=3034019 RepID=UPI0023F84188|nr:Crp/Fnr family transcriptional regulator [Hymenobacter sp. YC55]MDF7815880.1 Crp/Fnr family transcriptional regulator [Hymenobacter sp. YC55]
MSCYEALRIYIESYCRATMDATEYQLIQQVFQVRKIRKKQFLLRSGDICCHTGFIVRGAMRQYRIDRRGGEHIVQLAIENWWISDRESFYRGVPSAYTIDALEDTDLLVFTQEGFNTLLKQGPCFARMVTLLDERNTIAIQKRLLAALSHSAESRYLDFLDQHPCFAGRFPQHMLASYLGISPETLSRIRRSIEDRAPELQPGL